jgi:hypothetical protein
MVARLGHHHRPAVYDYYYYYIIHRRALRLSGPSSLKGGEPSSGLNSPQKQKDPENGRVVLWLKGNKFQISSTLYRASVVV